MPTLELAIDARRAKDGSLVFEASIKKVTGSVNEANSAMKKASSTTSKLLKVVGGIAAFYAAHRTLKQIITVTADMEHSVAQLKAGLISTNGVSGQTVASMEALATELQRTTRLSDDLVMTSEAILLSFTSISDDIFPRAVRAAVDISERMGTDLKSTILQVGKALNMPKEGLTALTRSGIQFSDEQKKVILQLVKTNQVAEAQRIILKELENQYGGSAKAAGDTLGGTLEKLKNAYKDLMQAVGGAGIVLAFEVITKSTIKSLNQMTDYINKNSKAIAAFVIDMIAFGKKVSSVLIFVVSNFKDLVSIIMGYAKPVFKAIGWVIQQAFGLIEAGIKKIPGWQEVAERFKGIDKWAEDTKNALNKTGEMLVVVVGKGANESAWSKFKKNFKAGADAVDSLMLSADGIGRAFETAFESAIFEAKSFKDVMEALLRDISQALVRALVIQKIVGGITLAISGGASIPAAMGKMFTGPGRVSAFAGGGVISSPITFPTSRGMGLAGEAGPEAVLPLSRTSSGKLGVESQSQRPSVINVYITTNDLDSFRRSRSQIRNDLQQILKNR